MKIAMFLTLLMLYVSGDEHLQAQEFEQVGQVQNPLHAGSQPFDADVLEVRPRIFVRNEPFDGLTIEKLRQRLELAEFAGVRDKWRSRPMGRALLWMVDGRPEDRDAAIAGLKRMDARGDTWSGRGLALMRLAALFDWLYPELDEATRRETIRKIEENADAAVQHVRRGQAPFFYTRTPGALAGLCLSGLALHGVSDKAEDYLATFREFGVQEYFRAYQWVDGAATGATYTYSYTYVDLPAICAAWWSATGQNPAAWIQAEQGDWLNGIIRFYLWSLRPGFAFPDINDQFRGTWDSHDQFCQGLDLATYVTRNGYGRTFSQRWLGRFGSALYHPEYAHHLIFRDPDVAPRPLTELPLAELFGRDSCGYGFFRSEWPEHDQPDTATHVFFRCGDPMDVHGGLAAGEFQVFKYAPLATRSGRYTSYDSPPDQYHRHCISSNVVLFTDPAIADDRGDQNSRRGLKSDHATWDDWLQIRERNQLDVAEIPDWQVHPHEARCRADLTKANPASKCRQWNREFVWLAGKHLIVLDIIQTARPEIRRQWQLHAATRPEIRDGLITITARPPDRRWADESLRPMDREGRLFCRTLIPGEYRLTVHSEGQAEAFDRSSRALGAVQGNAYHRQYGRNVIQIDPESQGTQTIFLHVLTAAEGQQTAPPEASYQAGEPGEIEVTVDGISTTLAVPSWFSAAR